jgi:hypothetical protein
MRRKLSLTIGLMLLVAGFLLLPTLFAQDTSQTDRRSAQQWEYRVLPMSDVAGTGEEAEQAKRVETKFNELGSEGWEFAQIHLRVAVFKRPKD